MTRNIPYRVALFIWNVIGRFHGCHCMHFRWGSSPCRRIFLLGIAHPVVGLPFRYIGCTGIRRFQQGRDYEEGRCVALILHLSNILQFFWDYCLNSQVCNYSKMVMIGLLRIVIKLFIFIFLWGSHPS